VKITPKEFIAKYNIKSLVCCFSGGKDSLVSTHYVMTETEDIADLDRYVIWVDTTVMIPPAEKFVRDVCNRFGWNLVILKPKLTFEEFCLKFGAPSIKRRWCCYHLKLEPIEKFLKTLRPQRGEILGLRREESSKRSKLPQIMFKKRSWAWGYCPILDWTKDQVLDYIKANDLPLPPWYKLGIKETCQCGAFSHIPELLRIKAQYPELFQRFIEIEKQFLPGRSFFFDRGKKVFAKEIATQKTLEEVMIE